MGHVEHRAHAPREVGCFVVTCSDTRTEADDRSGGVVRPPPQKHHHPPPPSAPAPPRPPPPRPEAAARSGALIRDLLKSRDPRLPGSAVVPDAPAAITAAIERAAADPATQAIILTGGAGLSRRDSTLEAIDRPPGERKDGFGG